MLGLCSDADAARSAAIAVTTAWRSLRERAGLGSVGRGGVGVCVNQVVAVSIIGFFSHVTG
jgi:hypothetical protein